jgi:hypothetical protein
VSDETSGSIAFLNKTVSAPGSAPGSHISAGDTESVVVIDPIRSNIS